MEFVVVKNPYVSSSTSLKEANDKHIRAQLMVIIRKMIQERGLSQKKAAELLGTTQSRISEIVNGKLDNHTIDKLFSMLNILGWDFKFGYSGGVLTASAEHSNNAVA
ncbi:TPA: XRE family transcriptional regulator [Klebsiella michiganensis]|uniref:XRE family transcriptional regulator n=1 Tax=Klebsiella michiganensis TaxID=1134687 RepID=A0A6P1UV70_9ENTR|nr:MULTISPECIES: helix-turn-helix transcriptional regulator [Klebsiella]MBF8468535.1 XRE family transcriptional regulator [Klebsiella oxytoca]MBK4129467.1 XRE family transcriptional regulator [Klebsiella michiganensis]MBZ7699771.1 XRE family transcriptional regulator [Klebsiella oxytoca]QHS46263.1 XRE family transcriptional regulator [Klebsiella michiganensis]HBM3131042.1 XRE family transcriptional regulator [Klebsiella michiganensis]